MNTKEFLETLYCDIEGKYLYLWTVDKDGKKTTHWYRSEDIEQMALDANRVDGAGDTVYFGVGGGDKSKKQYERLTRSEVTFIPGVWIDVDINGDGHAGKNYPPSVDKAIEVIEKMPLKPSLIVRTGGGLHCYYLFKEPWELDTEEEKIKASYLLTGIRALFKRHTQYDIDPVQDFARVLRPVGTNNRKLQDNIRPVELLIQSDIRYNFDDIDGLIPEPVEDKVNKSSKRDGKCSTFERRDTDQPAQLLLDNCQFIKHCKENSSTLSYPEWLAMIGNVSRCKGGIEVVHELSKSHHGYSESETDAKIYESLNYMSPASCNYIQEVFKCESRCAGITNPFHHATGGKKKQSEHESENEDAIPWPDDLNISAFHGLAGEIVKTISPHTEADESALLANFLVAFGNCIGRNAHFEVSGDTHYTNLFCSLVGVSAGGKKGTSWGYINKLFRTVDEFWTNEKVTSGLSSGEGLIWAIRDTIYKKKRRKKAKPSAVIPEHEEDNEDDLEVEVDGVPDKRILLNESEFGGKVLQSFKREGNTLSGVLREAWDAKYILQSLTKGEKAKTTKGHISMIGHVTKAELLSKLDEVEMMNGLGNRILWVCCRQSKQLPLGGNLSDNAIQELAFKLLDTIEFSKTVGNMQFDPSVYEIWSNVYSKLSEPKAGIVGAGLARAVPQVRRLACIYALLDKSDIVRLEHIKAALAFWTRCEQSVEYIFGKSASDPVIEKIIKCLSEGDKSQTEIYNYFQTHLSSKKIRIALENLSASGKVVCCKDKSKGRPKTTWQLVKK